MEQVYVLPATMFPPAQDSMLPLETLPLKTIELEGFFMERARAEEDPGYRQVIPYALVRYQDRYFLMRRTMAGGESRLYNRYTLGVGGHINPEDLRQPHGDPLRDGLRRELAEEVGVHRYTAEPVGLIVMADSPVNSVHAGIVFVVDSEDEPRVREVDKLEGCPATLDEVLEVYEELEGWSRVVVDWLVAQQEHTKLTQLESGKATQPPWG